MTAYWFTDSPAKIARDHLGLTIHPGKLRDLVDLADGDIGLWYLLSLPDEQKPLADDLVNLILGPLAVVLKERGLGFRDWPTVLHPTGLSQWLEALSLGLLPKELRKDFDRALVTRYNAAFQAAWATIDELFEPSRAVFYDLLCEFTEPLFAGPSNSELEGLIDRIMAENPTQVEKARAEPKLIGWFIGQVNKVSATKIDPNAIRTIIEAKLV